MDNLRTTEDVERFLRGIRLNVEPNVVGTVLSVLLGDISKYPVLYSVYSGKKLGSGERQPPICGKGTAYKIKNLYEEGRLGPFLEWWNDLPHSAIHSSENEGLAAIHSKRTLTDIIPRLHVSEPRHDWWDHLEGPESAFFITLEVGAALRSEADCWASLIVEEPIRKTFPLHWADNPYLKTESKPDFATITRDVPARLDVAFAPRRSISTPTIKPITSGVIPRLGTEYSSSGLPRLADWDGKGCWIAQPFALNRPSPRLGAFLPPREYRVLIRIYCQRDTLAFERVYLLASPEHPEGLSLAGFLRPTSPD